MNIQTAARIAAEENKYMVRELAYEEGARVALIKPTNSYDGCLLCMSDGEPYKIGKICRCWEPTLEDLTADDWKIVEAVNAE